MPRPAYTPWGDWRINGLIRRRTPVPTFAEVNAIRQAYATGRFSKASIARMYDVQREAVDRAIKGTYSYLREM